MSERPYVPVLHTGNGNLMNGSAQTDNGSKYRGVTANIFLIVRSTENGQQSLQKFSQKNSHKVRLITCIRALREVQWKRVPIYTEENITFHRLNQKCPKL
jgi:hypothetical protein